jgi:putative endonuclease
MCLVYAIKSSISGRVYIGQTENFDRRLVAHNTGRVRSTSVDKPWVLLKIEPFNTRAEARWAERQLKASKGRRERWLNL